MARGAIAGRRRRRHEGEMVGIDQDRDRRLIIGGQRDTADGVRVPADREDVAVLLAMVRKSASTPMTLEPAGRRDGGREETEAADAVGLLAPRKFGAPAIAGT